MAALRYGARESRGGDEARERGQGGCVALGADSSSGKQPGGGQAHARALRAHVSRPSGERTEMTSKRACWVGLLQMGQVGYIGMTRYFSLSLFLLFLF